MADDEIIIALRDQRKESKDRRARNRANGLAVLRTLGVHITSRNKGAHLIVRKGKGVVIDYYPGTGLWKVRTGFVKGFTSKEGRGIASLKDYLSQLEIPNT